MANPNEFISKHQNVAINESIRSGIPASIIMAQAILESNWGQSGLTINANNYFGIKADSTWKGDKYNADTGEVYGGKEVVVNANFRAYNNPKESFRDHSEFLMKFPRYESLWSYPITDYANWATGLKKANYATDPSYDTKLISLIEKYGLNKLDQKAKDRRLLYRILTGVGIAVGIYVIYVIIKNI